MLDGGPAWTSVKPRATSGYSITTPSTPPTLNQWKEYVQKLDYKGKIDYWEVWNRTLGEVSPRPFGICMENCSRTLIRLPGRPIRMLFVVGMDTWRGMDDDPQRP